MRKILFVILLSLTACTFTPEDNLKYGIENYNDGDYELAINYFSKISKEDSLFDKAIIYVTKIDSIYKYKKVNDSIDKRNSFINDSINKRKSLIEKQFNAWDGSHRNFEAAIKNGMNDPKSYEHVETVYRDLNDRLLITTTFRGKNAFGGVVKNSISAYFDLNGKLIEVVDQ